MELLKITTKELLNTIESEADVMRDEKTLHRVEQYRESEQYADGLPALTWILNDWMHCGSLCKSEGQRKYISEAITGIQELLINLSQSDKDSLRYVQEQIKKRVN